MAASTNTTGRRPTSKGVLRPEEMARHVDFAEAAPTPAAAPWVERVWSVAWDLPPGVEHVTSIVPHPSFNLTVERGDVLRDLAPGPGVWVTGVVTRRFDAVCRGAGGVVGAKFHPGAFAALTGVTARAITDRVLPAGDLVPGVDALAGVGMHADRARDDLCAFVEGLAARAGAAEAHQRVALVMAELADPAVTRVDELATRCGLSVRGLQRLLRRYVGVGPKWLVARRRMHDAVAAIDAGFDGSLADLAARFGWYDQNQFTRDFTALVGETPSAYRGRHTPSPRP